MAIVWAAVLFLPAPTAGQSAAPAPAVVDFRALTAAGEPVLDLTAGDVTLRVGGRPRVVTSLELVRATPPQEARRPRLPSPFATNSASLTVGRDVVIVVDEESIAPGREPMIRESIAQLIGALAPGDRVRMLSTRQGGPSATLSEERGGAPAFVATFTGHSTPSETENQLLCRTADGLRKLGNFFASYTGNTTPTVVIFSGGFGAPPVGGATRMPGSGPCPPVRTTEFEEVGIGAQAVHATAYVVYAVDATASPLSRDMLQTGLETLAGTLGAEMVRLVGPSPTLMQRIARETFAHYLATYQPDAGERPGTRQRVEVTVARDGVTVRARPDIVLMSPVGSGGKRGSPDDMLRGATTWRELPLQVAAFTSRGEGGKARLSVVFEPAEPGVTLTGAAVGLYDAKGRLTRWTAERQELARAPAIAGIIVEPGTYRLRLAAVDSKGRMGTVDAEVQARLEDAGAIRLSTLLLGVSSSDGGFSPRLQFSGDPGAFGYLEVYGVTKGMNLAVTYELAEDPTGPALANTPVTLADGPADDVRIAYSGFAIDGMAPGDLVLRAIVTVDAKVVGQATRTLRKVK